MTSNKPFKILALYKFVTLPDLEGKKEVFKTFCEERNIKGTLLLAKEGINGTIAGSCEAIDAFYHFLLSFQEFESGEYKFSYASTQPFLRLKVRLKKEIVTLGIEGVDPTQKVGTYVNPQDWNSVIQDPDVTVIDTRNDYEFNIGTFKRSLNPATKTFREFPHFVQHNLDPKKHKKIAMHCTGGIRCEKASAYMLSQGFEEVYHLKGGILAYLEAVPQEESLWEGECFVFDRRVTVENKVSEGHHKLCYGCRHPLSMNDLQSPFYEEGVACPHCYSKQSEKTRKRAQERHRQTMLAKSRGSDHLGT